MLDALSAVVAFVYAALASFSPPPPVATAAIELNRAEEQRYYSQEEFFEVIRTTAWEADLHTGLWLMSACETTGSVASDTIDAWAVGDRDNPVTGPSVGALQINIDVHTDLNAQYDLYDLRQNLIAAHTIYVSAGYSFWPWVTCSRLAGLR